MGKCKDTGNAEMRYRQIMYSQSKWNIKESNAICKERDRKITTISVRQEKKNHTSWLRKHILNILPGDQERQLRWTVGD